MWADLERTSTWLSTCRSTKESRLNQTCPVLLTLISLLFKSSVWSRDDLWQSVNTISAPSASANFFPLCGPLRDQTATALTVCTHLVWEGGGWGGRVRFWRLVLIKLILGPFFICQSARMALHVSLSQFICLRSYLPHERPRQPPIRRRMIIVSAFPGKNAGKGKGLAFIPPLVYWSRRRKKSNGFEATGSWKQSDCATIAHQSVNHNLSNYMCFMNKKLKSRESSKSFFWSNFHSQLLDVILT